MSKQQELFEGAKPKVVYKRVRTFGTGKYALIPVMPEKFDTRDLNAIHRYTDKINGVG